MIYNLFYLKKSKLFISFLTLSLFSFLGFSQVHHANLDINSVSTIAHDDGHLFKRNNGSAAEYELPKGSGNHLIYTGGFMLAGMDQSNQLRLAANTFGAEQEFYRGPFSSNDSYLDTAYLYEYPQSIWTVKKSDIEYHIDNYDQPNYQAPVGIKNWPGNGNTTIGVAEQLAPYIDVDGNDIYEPSEGDYPCIKGDMATYTIVNDHAGGHYNTDGEKLGVEIHIMLHQFESDNYIDSTTFVNLKIFNRGQYSYDDFKTAFFIDGDIGFSEDEYIGCDSSSNLMYTYNGTNSDPGGNGAPGYGQNPPALGIVSLNKTMEYFCKFGGNQNMYYPTTPNEYWNYLNGKWSDGTDWTFGDSGYGGTTPTQYLYTGNPYAGTGWTELDIDGSGTQNPMFDQRTLMVIEAQTLNAGDDVEYDFAVISSRKGDHLENVQGVIDLADSVKIFYDDTLANYDCQQQGTGTPDVIEGEPIVNYQKMFEITRSDGEGNMMNNVELKWDSEQDILDSNAVQKVTYQRGKGPISAELVDTVNHATGHFVLKFNDYGLADTANWTIYHYDQLGGNLIDSVNSNTSIDIGDEQIISQWGMSVQVRQENYPCIDGGYNCAFRDRIALPISASMEFTDTTQRWLTGVKYNNGMTPLNWLMSGTFDPPFAQVNPNDSIYDPGCYNSNFRDPDNLFTDLIDGIIAPGNIARYNECEYLPIAVPGSPIATMSSLISISNIDLPTVYHPSVDIVITSDKSKWTRCAVIELNSDENTSLNGGKPGMLRQSPSIDKEGRQPGDTGYNDAEAGKNGTQPEGMGWFPGYAIDVETGRRLNMAYCENSTMVNDNGTDMQWNPTENLLEPDGTPVLGGQHTIYVFGGEKFNMPNYDEGDFIYNNLSAEESSEFRAVYGNLSWVMQPLLEVGENLNSSDVRIKARINKEFKSRTLSDLNDSRPMFEWDVVPYEDVSVDESITTTKEVLVNIYPNPTNNKFTASWKNISVEQIKIYSLNGKMVNLTSVNKNSTTKVIDVSHLNSGIYFVQIGEKVRKLVLR